MLDDLAEAGLADPERTGATLARASAKAWRYVAEMEEIAQTQDAAGLRKDLFAALASVYGDLAAAAVDGAPEEVLDTVSLDAVLDRFAAARTVPDGVTQRDASGRTER